MNESSGTCAPGEVHNYFKEDDSYENDLSSQLYGCCRCSYRCCCSDRLRWFQERLHFYRCFHLYRSFFCCCR